MGTATATTILIATPNQGAMSRVNMAFLKDFTFKIVSVSS